MTDVINYLIRFKETFMLPKDLLEIALIAGLIYLVYRSLRGTRGARIIRGFIFLLIMSFVLLRMVSGYLHMERLNYLYERLVPLILVIAIVVFQPELRRSLTRLGENPLLRFFLKSSAIDYVDRVIRSAVMLSRNKVGSIMALERESRLDGIAETGIPLDAELTSELLTTLFWPGSPLHDMGVVVRGGRIVAAGCEFPLSHHAILDPHLGTRHRAAIGLTEETDAVVIVVSEETGTISLAEGGTLETPLTPEELRQRLMQLLRGTETPAKAQASAERGEPAPPAADPPEPSDSKQP